MDDNVDTPCKIKIQHGTTTLGFKFKDGVVVCVDSRATAGPYIGRFESKLIDFSFSDCEKSD